MTCNTFQGDGVTFIACNRAQRRKQCGACKSAHASFACDFPLKGRKAGKTCDVALCERCAVRQPGRQTDGETIDYCPVHDRLANKEADSA